VLYFYDGNNTDHHNAYFVETEVLENLNNDADTNMTDADPKGRLFYWADTVDEVTTDKVVMFTSTFDLADANATFTDFYYIDHFDGDERHPHPSAEFEDEAKAPVLERLNAYLAAQNTLRVRLAAALTAETSNKTLCNFYSVEEHHDEDGVDHEELFHYVLDTTGTLYKFEEEDNGDIEIAKDSNEGSQIITVSADGVCRADQSGISQAEEGVLVFFGGNEQKLHLVDAHGENKMHVHSTWEISRILGAKIAQQMVGIGALDVESDHSDHDQD
jgi:hypothetical protein